MDRVPHPSHHLSRRQIWVAGGLLAVAAAGGLRQAWPEGDAGIDPIVAAADGTMPHIETVTSTLADKASTTATTTTEAPVASTLPDQEPHNVDATSTSTTSSTSTTTTTVRPTPIVPPETSPDTLPEEAPVTETTLAPEVEALFQLPEFTELSPEEYQKRGEETVYVNLGENGCSGTIIKAEGRIVGARSAVHCLPLNFRELDGRQVIDHYGSITIEQGDQADQRTVVGQIEGVLIPDGQDDTMLLIAAGEDWQTVQNAYNETLTTQRPERGDVVVVSGWPDAQNNLVDKRQAQTMIFIGTHHSANVQGRSMGPLDVYVAGRTADGATLSPGYSGAGVVDGSQNAGTVSFGEVLVREPGIFGTADLYSNMFKVDLSRPDIAAVALVTPAQPLEMTYYELNNTNRNEVYAEEIAAIQAEAYEALQDEAKPKIHANGVIELNYNFFIGSTTASKLQDPIIHVDEAGNTLVYGRDPSNTNNGIGMMMFIPANTEARLEIRSADELTSDNLLSQTNGAVTPAATLADSPDYQNVFRYTTVDGIERNIGRALMDWPEQATNNYAITITNGQVSLVDQAVDQPPVPPTTV